MNRIRRFCVALVGAFTALYLVGLLVSPLLLDVLAWTASIRAERGSERLVALVVAGFGTIPFAVRYASERGSLERLWTFVIAVHLLAYLLLLPYFHVVDVAAHTAALHPGSPGSVAYYATGYGLLVLAVALSYVLVYRDGHALVTGLVTRRFGN